MTGNWTDLDPGAGDTSACATAKEWTDAQLTDLTNAQTTVTTILRDLDNSWIGDSATAFRSRLEVFRKRLEDSAQAMETAGKAILAYGDAVEEIARKAEPLKSDLAAAQATLNGIFDDVTFDRYTNDGAGSRFTAEQQARKDANTAAAALQGLADDRRDADLQVAAALATTASIAWDALDGTIDPITGTKRDATNEQVMDLFEHFRTGDERGEVLTDDDIFVRKLKTSEHIQSVREQVLQDLRNGVLAPDSPGVYDRRISDKPQVLLGDLGNFSSLVLTGTIPNDLLSWQNMPESFLGSYGLEVRAGAPQTDGGVEVTFVINNDTSIDSATRIPGTGGAHIPGPFEAMSEANARNGEWATHHQTIVWTEKVYP
ncbi:WXG100 family type VII secretion target [Microbacterium sp. CGR1]|uniref:WXG100 family type VII secretion target n=1 Tax=Microbacterium sp. CGR1 TaxID=1696072 RepID=UPI003DA66ED9